MKQILQSIKTGCTEIADVPVPKASRGSLSSKLPKPWYLVGLKECLLILGRPACSIRHVNNLTR